ncbi:DNA-binding transcriptional LysR family regulator [Roseovarius sp. MBR-51]|jgi:DNA-binding transcriptional LysR family regulator|uniref:LysR family transcriptional regulator n=1 Tax=Roseovarius sp. BRH_c41 TaxID=1629709 RepID=UPI0005F19878|nr:LysR family transcriptional regulator [Roseovarius sp. BRH_c41]KJS40837.1 MAG: transcriptional regulator [Roseovarius sp. BRH_c41]
MKLHPSVYEAFQVVMRSGTVSGAADYLGRSQPAVSRMIDKLESSVGVKLFERRKGRVVPTHAAHLLLDEVERLFVSLSSLDDFSRRMEEGQDGGVRIAALPALGLDFLPEVISRFSKDRPQARVKLNVRMSVSVEKWVATQQVDFGLAETPFQLSGFGTRIFADTVYIAAIPADHALAEEEVVRPDHLRREPLIGWTVSVSARRIFDDIMQGAGIVPQQLIETTMSATMCSMVKRGLGLAVVDPFTAWANPDPRIVYRPFLPQIPCRFALLRPDTRTPTVLATELIGHAESLRDEVLAQMR